MEWWRHIGTVTPHVVKISTPGGHGTGFLVHRNDERQHFTIATAAHVIRDAHAWEQTITICGGGAELRLRPTPEDRAIGLHPERDSAYIISRRFPPEFQQTLPEAPLPVLEAENSSILGLRSGGWASQGLRGGTSSVFSRGM